MAQLILKPAVIEQINKDQVLFGKVAKAMDLGIRTLYEMLPKNPPRLANATVLAVLREHLGMQDSEMLEEMQQPATA